MSESAPKPYSSSQSAQTSFRSIFLTLRILVVLSAAVCIWLSFKCAHARLRMPFEIDYEEGNMLNTGLRIVHGQTMYPSPGSFPYILNPYGPIGYLVSAAGVKIFGVGLFGPRLLALSAGLGVVALIAALTRIFGGRRDAGVLLALSYLSLPLVCYWLPLLRVDFWAIFLSLLGLYLFVRFPFSWPLAGLVFGCAILTKQTAVAAPAAVVLELIAQRRVARAIGIAGVVAATVCACMLALGKGFLFAFLETHPDPYSLRRVFQSGFSALHGCMLVLVVIAYALVFGFRWTQRSRLAWLYVFLCSVTAFSSGKLGSNMNHFLEWTAAVCIICGLALSRLLEENDSLAIPFSLGLLTLSAVFSVMSLRNFGVIGVGQSGCTDAYRFIRSFPGDRILSEDVSALALAGKTVLVSNPFVITQLGSSTHWQAGTLEEMAEHQYFDLIVVGGTVESSRPGGWSPRLMQIVANSYVPTEFYQCPHAKVAYVRAARNESDWSGVAP